MKKVLILGASGMLGHSMVNEFAAFKGQVIATKRPTRDVGFKYEVELRNFNAETDDISHVAHDFGPDDFIINCIGYVKSHINENESASVRQAVSLNSLFHTGFKSLFQSLVQKLFKLLLIVFTTAAEEIT